MPLFSFFLLKWSCKEKSCSYTEKGLEKVNQKPLYFVSTSEKYSRMQYKEAVVKIKDDFLE